MKNICICTNDLTPDLFLFLSPTTHFPSRKSYNTIQSSSLLVTAFSPLWLKSIQLTFLAFLRYVLATLKLLNTLSVSLMSATCLMQNASFQCSCGRTTNGCCNLNPKKCAYVRMSLRQYKTIISICIILYRLNHSAQLLNSGADGHNKALVSFDRHLLQWRCLRRCHHLTHPDNRAFPDLESNAPSLRKRILRHQATGTCSDIIAKSNFFSPLGGLNRKKERIGVTFIQLGVVFFKTHFT